MALRGIDEDAGGRYIRGVRAIAAGTLPPEHSGPSKLVDFLMLLSRRCLLEG